MSHILVLQWPGSSEADFEELVRMEYQLDISLSDSAGVDGHDFGSGEANIFIERDDPAGTLAEVDAILSQGPRWADLRAAYRESTGDTYVVLWPVGYPEFRVG